MMVQPPLPVDSPNPHSMQSIGRQVAFDSGRLISRLFVIFRVRAVPVCGIDRTTLRPMKVIVAGIDSP